MANKKVSQLTSKPSVLVTDLFPIADPSTGQLYKTTISDLGTAIGSGVSSVNGLVGAVVLDTDDIQELVSPTNKWFTDTRARAALSASSPLAYNSGTGVFSIPAATSSQNGYLTSTDWSTFNSKQAALSGTGFVKISGTTISYDNTAYLPLAGGTLTGALFGASASFSGFVGFGGNTSPLAAIDVTGAGIFSSSVRSSGYYLTGMTSGSGALYYSSGSNRVTVANYNASGIVTFEVNGGNTALTLNSNLSATFASTLSATGATLTGALSGTSATFSGSVGVGNSLSSWGSIKTLQRGSTSLFEYGINNSVISSNFYYDGGASNYYMNNGYASFYQQYNGGHAFYTSPSGTSGNAITFTKVLDIASTGAATFSSSVTVASTMQANYVNIQAGGNAEVANINSTNANGGYLTWQTSGSVIADIGTLQQIFGSGGSTNFGINARGAKDLAFGTNNTERLRITSSGNVGIGTTSPATALDVNGVIRSSKNEIGFQTLGLGSKLEVYSASYENIAAFRSIPGDGINPYLLINTSSSGITLEENGSSYGALMFKTGGSERMRITSSGNVGIGTTSPSGKLDVLNAGDAYVNILSTNPSTSTVLSMFNTSGTTDGAAIGYNTAMRFGTITGANAAGFTERMRITSGGLVEINRTSDLGNGILEIDGTSSRSAIACNQTATTTRYQIYFSNPNGIVGSISTNGSVTSYNITSDYRLKEDLKPINGLEIVNKIKVYDYKWKSEDSRMDGVLAHELAEVLPYAVTGIKDGEQMQSVDYSKIVPVMVQAIKDLKAELDTLKNK